MHPTNPAFLYQSIVEARNTLDGVAIRTPTSYNTNLSTELNASVYLKREDLQVVRSYKLRGAYNKIKGMKEAQRTKGIVCASAGNHAQGVAYSCQILGICAKIYMPIGTTVQKVKQVQLFGKDNVEIVLGGATYDDAYQLALQDATESKRIFIHPFDDPKIIAGQGTVGLEIIESLHVPIDYVFVPIGGGGLASGIITVFATLSPLTRIIGVEPAGAASMKLSIEKGVNTTLESIDRFVDGAAVKRVGELTFPICLEGLHDVVAVPEGKVCSTLLRLYNEEAMVVEPAGALAVAALDLYKKKIEGKVAVCIVTGGNNDIMRTEEIKERSLSYEGLKHYFRIQFHQRPGLLKAFIEEILGEDVDLTYFQFLQNNKCAHGHAIVGIELKSREHFPEIIKRLNFKKYNYTYLSQQEDLLQSVPVFSF